MDKEIQHIIKLHQSTYDGSPWFGRSMKKILAEIDADIAIQKPEGQHSVLELLYHMINWREFTISRLEIVIEGSEPNFENRDWGKYDHADKTLWKKGLKQLEITQKRLLELIKKLNDDDLTSKVAERSYNVRYLLYGLNQHDIYHLGQIAYIKKMIG